jgi:hypothetical protein
MNKILVFIFLFTSLLAYPQQYRTVQNTAFVRGEKLTFRIAFNSALTGSITGGKATLEVKNENKIFNNRSTFHVVGQGWTTGIIELFYKIDDKVESYFDDRAFISWQFIRRTRENSYKKDDLVIFRQNDRLAVSLSKVVKVPANIQDVVSAFYYARTINIADLKPGSIIEIPFFLDDSVYISKVKFEGIENIKTSIGTFRCLKIAPMMATGEIFSDAYPLKVWVTDDKNHVPILVETKVIVGSIKMELIEYKHLRNPFEAKLPD